MNTAVKQLSRPLYAEAREYCERHGIESLEDLERARMYMCVCEFHKQMRPWNEMLVKAHPAMYSINHDATLPDEYVALQAQVKEIAQRIAAELGLEEMQ